MMQKNTTSLLFKMESMNKHVQDVLPVEAEIPCKKLGQGWWSEGTWKGYKRAMIFSKITDLSKVVQRTKGGKD